MSELPVRARWNLIPRQPEIEEVLERELGVSEMTATLLVQRGFTTPETAEKFLNPRLEDLYDPKLLPDYDEAVKLLLRARDSKEKIFLHGDYDVDGVSSTALLYRFLSKVGCNVVPHVPHRMREGYGIKESIVEDAAASGAEFLLTCDCGASAIPQIAKARSLGMTVVVTDHHQIGAEHPDAHAFVNPHRKDSKYPFADLCGVGVAFKLCMGITQELNWPVEMFFKNFLDLACLGTIADVMPLVDENRIIVSHGLPRLSETTKPGLLALFRAANMDDRVKAGLTSHNVGHQIGPRLNAAGRISDAVTSLKLLLAENIDEAMPIAQELEQLNQDRRNQQEAIIQEAIEKVVAEGYDRQPIIVVEGTGWHPGIVGIVAGRLKDKFHRPVFVLAYDEEKHEYKGSGRSIPGYNLAEMIQSHAGLVAGGGHEKAAGMSIHADNLDEARRKITEHASEILSSEDLRPSFTIAAELSFRDVTLTGVEELSKLEPFGEGNPKPLFCTRGVKFEQVRETRNPDHPQIMISHDGSPPFRFSAFYMGPRFAAFPVGATGDIIYELGTDTWKGTTSVSWKLTDFVIESDEFSPGE